MGLPIKGSAPQHGQALLSARGLNKSFRAVHAVSDIDLDLNSGSILGLLGKNGAGKSSLIKLLTGVEQPDSGTISVGGELVRFKSTRDAHALGITAMYQERVIAGSLSVADAVLLGLGYETGRIPFLVSKQATRARARRYLQMIGVTDEVLDIDKPVGTLSVALQRLVMIARAIAGNSQVIILDEPTVSLTNTEVESLHDVLRRLRDQGASIVYVSHRIEEIKEICDRYVVMRDGRAVDEGTVGEASSEHMVRAITGDEDVVASYAERPPRKPAVPTTELLSVRDVSDGRRLRKIDLTVNTGEIVGLAGLVGSGRTELLELLAGLTRPIDGEITLNGQPYQPRSPRDALREGVVLIPEDRRSQGIFESFNIRENAVVPILSMARRRSWMPLPSKRREQDLTREMISEFNVVAPDTEQSILQLSGGNQQKLILGRWVTTGGNLFLLDEPTIGIDIHGKREITDRLRQLAAEGKSILVISSEFEELPGLCDRIYVLREGVTTLEMDGGSTTPADLVRACYASE